jgi:hypothetical protein
LAFSLVGDLVSWAQKIVGTSAVAVKTPGGQSGPGRNPFSRANRRSAAGAIQQM